MKLLYFMGHPPNFGDELNWYIFESLFVYSNFQQVQPETYFMGIGSILHPAYLEKISVAEADIGLNGGVESKMNRGVVFGSGVREHSLDYDAKFLDFRFVRGPISAEQTGETYIADAAYLLPLLKEHDEIRVLPKKYKVSLMPYFHHVNVLDYDKISSETGVNIIQPYDDVYKILCEVQQSKLVVSGAMHGCIAADIYRVPWIRLRFETHETNPVVQVVKWLDYARSMDIDILSCIRMRHPNAPDKRDNIELERELIDRLQRLSEIPTNLSKNGIFNGKIDKLADAVRRFSADYDIKINKARTIL